MLISGVWRTDTDIPCINIVWEKLGTRNMEMNRKTGNAKNVQGKAIKKRLW